MDILLEIVSEADSVEKEKTAKHSDLKGVSVLLAEDNDLNAEIATIHLESTGMQATRATDGKQAVSLFHEKPKGTFDIILMDGHDAGNERLSGNRGNPQHGRQT